MRKASGSIDIVFLGIVFAIIVFGFIMLLSASSPTGYTQFGDSYYFVKHQLIFGLLPGIAAMIVFTRVPYAFWRKHAWNLLIISLILLVLVFIPGISAGIGSAHSWISIGGYFSIQPAEIVKLTFLFYLAAWLGQRTEHSVASVNEGFLPFFLVLGGILLLLILQPDIGTMSIIAITSLIVYFVAGAPIRYVVSLLFAGAGALGLLIASAPYRIARFTTFLHPELDPLGIGYHTNQALLALGSGGLLGVGYGQSRQKFLYLPEVAGDSIFAIIGEELGLVVALLTIGLFVAFMWRAVEIAKRAPDKFSKYVVVGIASWIVVQAIVNIGAMVALLPLTGVPLPFISYGGTALAVSMAAVGAILNISKFIK